MRNKPFGYGECKRSQMTVGELEAILEEFPGDARIFIESENSHIRNDTIWAQEILDSYCCEDKMRKQKALMLVGSAT